MLRKLLGRFFCGCTRLEPKEPEFEGEASNDGKLESWENCKREKNVQMNYEDADEKAYLSRNRDISRYHTNEYRVLYTYVVEGLESARDTRSTSLKGDVDEPKRKRKVTFSDSHVEFAYLERDPVAPYLSFVPETEAFQWLHCGENCECGTAV